MRQRIKIWGAAIAIGLAFAFWGNSCSAQNAGVQQIAVNAPQAMHVAFEKTFEDLKLDDEYGIKFIDGKESNLTVTNQKSSSSELIAYSPVVAVFNKDDELYQSYIEKEIFVPSDTESEAYDLDFKKIMTDIIENPDSMYKVYYPDETMCDWSVFYAFLLYTANDGCYPSSGTNMAETRQIVNAFMQSKNTEPISRGTVERMGGFAKNSVYFIPLADLGYVCEKKGIECRVMYPKTVVYCNYYASFDEVGKILYEALETDKEGGFLTPGTDNVGYYNLRQSGNYFVKPYKNDVYIAIPNVGEVKLRKNFNAVDVEEKIYFSKEED